MVEDAFVVSELFETDLGHSHVLQSSNEELVLARLQEESENHHDHAILSGQFLRNYIFLRFAKIFGVHHYEYLLKGFQLVCLLEVFELLHLDLGEGEGFLRLLRKVGRLVPSLSVRRHFCG
jgi:hypothetical protein